MKAKTGKNLKIKDKPKSVSMMGKSTEPWKEKAKKPEADAKPKNPGPKSTNKNAKSMNSAKMKKLTGTLI